MKEILREILSHARDKTKNIFSIFLLSSKFTITLYLFTNMTLSTLLILAIYGKRVI